MNSHWSYCPATLNSGQNRQFLSRATLKLDGWPWKTIRHLFYATLSFVHHFKAISELILELQSRNAQFGSKSAIFVPYDLEIWRMTLKNNRAPLLCCFKLYASFHSHLWIQTKVTVRKRSIRAKIGDFLSRVTLKFDGWCWKRIRHLFYATSSFVHHFVAIDEFKLELQSGRLSWLMTSVNLTFHLWPTTLTFCMDITSVIGNNSWKIRDDAMRGT